MNSLINSRYSILGKNRNPQHANGPPNPSPIQPSIQGKGKDKDQPKETVIHPKLKKFIEFKI